MKELWDNIMKFMTGEAFKIADFAVLWWYVIVAAAAVVVLLLVITIAVACSKKKKKKLAKSENDEENNQSIHKKKNAAQVQPFNEIAPDWQPVVVAPEKSKTEDVQADTLDNQDVQPQAENDSDNTTCDPVIEKETIVEEQQAGENVPEQAEAVAQPTPNVAERIEKTEEKQEEVAIAERIRPVRNTVVYTAPKAEPKPVQQPVVEKAEEQKPVEEEPVVVQQIEEEQPIEDVVELQSTEQVVEQVVEQPVEKKPSAVKVVKQPVATEDNKAKKEVAATTAPRALPKKSNKTTKKTAEQIADDIEGKTGTNPRKKTDKPAVIGQDKLPKKSTKAQKNEVAKAVTSNVNDGELPLITTDPNVESFGKFIIIKNDDNSARPFHFRLLANNGQILFESESYKSKPKSNSIIAFKKAAANEANFEIDADKAGNWRYKLYNAQHAVIGVGESYSTKQGCENSVQSVIKFAESARLLEDHTEA